jgi:CubicO group peptidase (beta-lactamase class C family)
VLTIRTSFRAIRLQLLIGTVAGSLGLTPGAALAQNQADEVAKYIETQMQWRLIPGVALGVVRGGRIVRAEGFGHTGNRSPGPVTPATTFHLGSVGKQFTAAALLILAQDGVISIDDPITKYLENTPAAWRDITIRQLLTHTSGLQNYVTAIPDVTREYTEAELRALIAAQPLAFKPGTGYRYSNSGYVLAGLIVQKASGLALGDFLSERIFRKLGMDSTALAGEPSAAQRLAPGYRVPDDTAAVTSYGSRSLNRTGDGSVFSTLLDLAKWDAALYGDAVLSASSRTLMWTPVKLVDGSTRPYGLGWAVKASPRHDIVEHSGVWAGFSAHIVRYITDSVTVIVLANLSGVGDTAGQIANKVARYYIPELRAAAWPAMKRFPVHGTILASYTGEYKRDQLYVRVSPTQTGLLVSARGRGSAEFIPLSAIEFRHPVDSLRLRFVTARSGVRQVVIIEGGRLMTFTKAK